MNLFPSSFPWVAACMRGALLLALSLATATAPAFAQFNLPPANTTLPGVRPAAPSPGAPFARQPSLPPADTGGLPGGDQRECGPTPHHALCAKGRWTFFSRMDVRVTARTFAASYRVEIADNNEVRATYRETADGKVRSGEVLLVGMNGVAYRTGEKFPADVSILDTMISMPLMMSQLVSLLLDQAVIGPPSDVTDAQSLKAGSAARYIRLWVPNGALLFGPPWRATGTVRPGKVPGELAFSLTLAYRPVDARGVLLPQRTDTLTLDGTLSFAPRVPTLPDTMSLKGFNVLRDDTPIAALATIGDLRKAIGP